LCRYRDWRADGSQDNDHGHQAAFRIPAAPMAASVAGASMEERYLIPLRQAN
jgi:hypothetical protein